MGFGLRRFRFAVLPSLAVCGGGYFAFSVYPVPSAHSLGLDAFPSSYPSRLLSLALAAGLFSLFIFLIFLASFKGFRVVAHPCAVALMSVVFSVSAGAVCPYLWRSLFLRLYVPRGLLRLRQGFYPLRLSLSRLRSLFPSFVFSFAVAHLSLSVAAASTPFSLSPVCFRFGFSIILTASTTSAASSSAAGGIVFPFYFPYFSYASGASTTSAGAFPFFFSFFLFLFSFYLLGAGASAASVRLQGLSPFPVKD